MDITGKVEIELVHGDDLTVSTTGGATFDTERGTLTWLADASESRATELCSKCLGETDCCGRFSFPQRRRRDTRRCQY